jgi:hypothetical protein
MHEAPHGKPLRSAFMTMSCQATRLPRKRCLLPKVSRVGGRLAHLGGATEQAAAAGNGAAAVAALGLGFTRVFLPVALQRKRCAACRPRDNIIFGSERSDRAH